jgi:LuxR family maltose regulon positive regulatory protein
VLARALSGFPDNSDGIVALGGAGLPAGLSGGSGRFDEHGGYGPASGWDDAPAIPLRRDPLLVTKLFPPPARPNRVRRRRLTELLDEGLRGQLTVVTAPAGYGKTTLLSAWAEECPLPVAWVSLDPGDNDPARFWSYVIAALQALRPEVRAVSDLPSGLAGRQPAAEPASREAVTLLINVVAAMREQLILVLDDYHVISAEPVHRVVSFLTEHLPAQLHLVIAGRTAPPLPLARLRAQGLLSEATRIKTPSSPKPALM